MPTNQSTQPESPQSDPPDTAQTPLRAVDTTLTGVQGAQGVQGVHPPELAEEIARIQALLRRLDGILAQKDEVSLKDLAQAVSTAGAGGRSIAQLRKLEKELERAVNDEDYEQARASMFAMIEKLRRRRKTKAPAEKAKKESPNDRPHPGEQELVE